MQIHVTFGDKVNKNSVHAPGGWIKISIENILPSV